jgi:hypothetical protein
MDSPILLEQFRALPDAANVVPNPGAQGTTPLQATPTALVESFRSPVTKQFQRGPILRINSFRKRIRLCICVHENFTKKNAKTNNVQTRQQQFGIATKYEESGPAYRYFEAKGHPRMGQLVHNDTGKKLHCCHSAHQPVFDARATLELNRAVPNGQHPGD